MHFAVSKATSFHAPTRTYFLQMSYTLVQDEFIFRVEGTGVLDCCAIVKTALDVLTSKLLNLAAHLETDAGDGADMDEG